MADTRRKLSMPLIATLIAALSLAAGFCGGYFAFRPIQGALGRWQDHKKEAERETKVAGLLGTEAPPFTARTIEGGAWSLEAHRGTTLLLVFWSPSCDSCLESLGRLNGIYQGVLGRPDLAMAGVPFAEDMTLLRAVCARMNITWPQLLQKEGEGVGEILRSFGVWKIPSLWLVDPAGRITGVDLAVEEVRKRLSLP